MELTIEEAKEQIAVLNEQMKLIRERLDRASANPSVLSNEKQLLAVMKEVREERDLLIELLRNKGN